MMKAGLDMARARGLYRVQLTAIRDNESAIHVYGKAGFRREGIGVDGYLGEDGKYHDTIEMGIVLE